MQGPVVSLHPHVKGDVNIALSASRGLVFSEEEALRRARAVVVSQAVDEGRYKKILSLCPRVFPDYRLRWCCGGKAGLVALAGRFHLPTPATLAYRSVAEFRAFHPPDNPPFPLPFVVKSDEGGGGNGVFYAGTREDLGEILVTLDTAGVFAQKSLVAQELVRHGGADLRVVVLGESLHPYWRVQETPGEFRNNVGRGAKIVAERDPERTGNGLSLAREVLEKTGINCAALDIAFDGESTRPLLMEINFVFGRKGIGGTQRFRRLFEESARQWIRSKF